MTKEALSSKEFRSIGALAQESVASAADHRRDRLLLQLAAILKIVTPHDRAHIQGLICAWLETDGGSGAPEYDALGPVRENANWWADMANPAEIEAYTAAGLRAIARRYFGMKARKRLIVTLWDGLDDADRAAFLSKVDPNGKFRGAA